MKLIPFFALVSVSIMVISCGQNFDDYSYEEDFPYEEEYYEENYDSYEGQNTYRAQAVNNRNGGGEIIMHSLKDPKTGMVSSQMPLPANWKITPQGIVGPNGITVKNYPGAQLYGRPINSVDEVIQTDISQNIQANGAQFLRVINLPEVARCNQAMLDNYWSVTPTQKISQVKGVEIKDAEGKLGLIVVNFMSFRTQYDNLNAYSLGVLTANPSDYEAAKKAYLYGISNVRQNPEYLAAYNRNEQQKSQASWAQHNAKMRSNQANFDRQQAIYKSNSDVSDIYYEGWKNRNAMNDAGHERSIDGIWEQQPMTDPYGGGQVKVESGYNNYYMNSYGEYFGTNDEFYNPQQDLNTNQEWRKMEGGGY